MSEESFSPDGVRSAVGVVLLNPRGGVVFADARARAFCVEEDGLALVDGALCVCVDGEVLRGSELHRFGVESRGEVHAVRVEGKDHRLTVRFLPLADREHGKSYVVCLLRDEEGERERTFQQFCARFRLSPSEVRLCRCLLDGNSLKEAATLLLTSYTAVRTRLKRIFEKTRVKRQAELMRLLLSEAPPVVKKETVESEKLG